MNTLKVMKLSSAAIVLWAPHAMAQTASKENTGGSTPSIGVEQVVVTAEKSAESLQNTPAAITALSGSSLIANGITDIRAAQNFVPSVRFQSERASTEIYIRGVGSTIDFAQIDPPTNLNFNGIYIPREATSVPLYDISQIEVLPGPQGTLYGRGSLGGVVNVNFRRPSFDHEISGLMEVGNYNLVHTSVAGNLPINDELAVRGAVDYSRHDGYQSSGADSADTFGGRLSLLYEPTEDLSIYVWGSIVTKSGSPANGVSKAVTPQGRLDINVYAQSNPWNDLLPANLAAVSPYGQVRAKSQRYDNHMFGGELDWNISNNITLTYIPSYLKFSVAMNYWLSGVPSNNHLNYDQQTHELRLAGTPTWGKWLFGVYAYRMDDSGQFRVGGFGSSGFPVSLIDFNRIEGVSTFGEFTYDLTKNLRLIGGGRFSDDHRRGRGHYFAGAGLAPFSADHSYQHFDYKVGVQYDLTKKIMTYATVQTGYQPGTYNNFASTKTVSNLVNPAKLTAYTLGVKSRWLNDTLQVNSEVYYYDYSDLFASAFNAILNSEQIFNAQKVRIIGNQTDITYVPDADDNFRVTVGYLHARNVKFVLPDKTANFDGLQLQYAPDWTVSAGYYHDFHWGEGFVRAQVHTFYESSFYGDFRHTPGLFQSAHTTTDVSVTYHSPEDDWTFGVWAKNLENAAVITASAAGSNIPFNSQGGTAGIEAPRTFGVRLTVND